MPPALGLPTKVFYGVGSVAYGVKDNGFAFFLLLYYNQVLGVPQRLVGAAIMIALVVDALSDPIVGRLSDHWHSRWGRRHPFMYAAALPCAASFYLLWNPPAWSQAALFWYLVCVAILVRTCITFFEIPSSSLLPELTERYDERTRVASLRSFFGWTGGLSLSIIAYRYLLTPDAEHPIGQLNPNGYQIFGLVACLMMGAAMLTSALGTHSRIPTFRPPPARQAMTLRHTFGQIAETLSNRSFIALFSYALFAAMAGGLSASLNIYFATFFWELSADELQYIVIGNLPAAFAAALLAPRLSARFDKRRAAIGVATAAALGAPVAVLARLLGAFPENDSPLLLPTLVAMTAIEVTLIITSSILVFSMMADVVEQSELETGRRSEGMFFASRNFIQKSVSGSGIFAATLVLGFVGFPENALPGEVPVETVRRLGWVYAPLIASVYGTAVLCLTRYGIGRAQHEDHLRALADRGKRPKGARSEP